MVFSKNNINSHLKKNVLSTNLVGPSDTNFDKSKFKAQQNRAQNVSAAAGLSVFHQTNNRQSRPKYQCACPTKKHSRSALAHLTAIDDERTVCQKLAMTDKPTFAWSDHENDRGLLPLPSLPWRSDTIHCREDQNEFCPEARSSEWVRWGRRQGPPQCQWASVTLLKF